MKHSEQKPPTELTPVQAQRLQYIWLILIGVVCFSLIAPFLGGCAARASPWHPASSQFNAEQIEAIATENSSIKPGTDEYEQLTQGMQSRQIEPGLIAIDFNSPLLRGRNGALFAIYKQDEGTSQRVLQTYLHPVPKGFQMLEATARRANGLPCLYLFQAPPYEGVVERNELCFDGSTYRLRDTQSLPIENSL